MRTSTTRRALAALTTTALGIGAIIIGALPAQAANCGFTAYDYISTTARSEIYQGDLCDRQRTKAKYNIGTNYTYTNYGSLASPAGNKWVATSLAVPAGKSVIGSLTEVAYLGNQTFWSATH